MDMPKVGIVSTDWSGVLDDNGRPIPGGANYVRLQQWQRYVSFPVVQGTLVNHRTRGIGVLAENGRIHHDIDVLIMQRLMFKDVKYLLRAMKKNKQGPVVINDLDDWYWGLDPANAAFAACQPKNNPEENINHYREIMELSDVITVSTPFLADKMTNWIKHDKVVLIQNCVDVKTFAQRQHRDRKPTVGWVGSTAHRSKDLEELHGLFDKSYRFHHTGAIHGAPSFVEALGLEDPSRLRSIESMPPTDYAKYAFTFDIGIAPLSDKPFNEAKSWIKCIEYAAAGVPFVASARSEYVRLQEEYGIGRIAHSRDEWVDHIRDLYNYRVRREESVRQHKAVKRLDVNVMARKWEELIVSLV